MRKKPSLTSSSLSMYELRFMPESKPVEVGWRGLDASQLRQICTLHEATKRNMELQGLHSPVRWIRVEYLSS